MCFSIDINAKTPRNRIAWKVVMIDASGYVCSRFREYKWKTGTNVAEGRRFRIGVHACSGIYVYLSKRRAMQCLHSNLVLMQVEVDAKDFLYRADRDAVATYRQVTVPEEQPYMEWY